MDPPPANTAVPEKPAPGESARTVPSLGHNYFLAAILLVWLLVYVPGLFRPALLDDADSVHAEAAREILQRHDWVTLHADGIRYLEKAPLLYWSMAGGFAALGVREWTARLPLALFTLASLLAVYLLGRRAYGEAAGFYAALVLATAFGIFIFTRILIPDLMIGLWLALGFYFFLRTLEGPRPSRLACWGLAATVALNALTKGLIGIVFPAAVIGAFLLLTRNLRHLGRMRWLSSTAVFLLIAAPWHVLAALRTPGQGNVRGWLWFYFVNEHFLRYLGRRVPHDYGTVPFVVFWGLLLVWLFPWSAYLPQALRQVPHANFSRLDLRQRASLLFAIWAAVVLVFFSFSTRQEYYVMPALPALALLTGGWLAQEAQAASASPLRRAGRVSATALLLLGAAAAVVAAALLATSQKPPPGTDIADLLKKNPGMYALSFGHFFDLTPQALGAFRGPLLATGAALLAGTALNWRLRRRGWVHAGNLALVGMMVIVLGASLAALTIFEPVLSSKALALEIRKRWRPGEVIVINGEYEEGSTLNFYTGQPVEILNGRSSDLWYGSLFPDAPRIFLDDDAFARLWRGPRRVYLWTDEQRWPAVAAPQHAQTGPVGRDADAAAHLLAKSGGKYLVSNFRDSF